MIRILLLDDKKQILDLLTRFFALESVNGEKPEVTTINVTQHDIILTNASSFEALSKIATVDELRKWFGIGSTDNGPIAPHEEVGRFDIIISDGYMPGIDGLEIAKQVLGTRSEMMIFTGTVNDVLNDQRALNIELKAENIVGKPDFEIVLNRVIEISEIRRASTVATPEIPPAPQLFHEQQRSQDEVQLDKTDNERRRTFSLKVLWSTLVEKARNGGLFKRRTDGNKGTPQKSN